jgi:short-subunit dehydrogenase
MKRQLAGQRVLITGATSGIGKALAEQAARSGMRVAMTGRKADALNELSANLTAAGHDVFAFPADITSDADRERLFAAIVERFGGLDVLINNAGIATQGLFSDSSEELLRQVMEVNFFAPAEMIRRAIPLLGRGRQPAIVQVGSMTGRRSMPFWTEYSASKFAISGLIESLRAELVRQGIDVLLVLPGVTRTSLGNNLLQHDGKIAFRFEHGMEPTYVASQILKILRTNRKETVLGWEAQWFIRVNRWLPRFVDWGLTRVVRRRYREQANGESPKES